MYAREHHLQRLLLKEVAITEKIIDFFSSKLAKHNYKVI